MSDGKSKNYSYSSTFKWFVAIFLFLLIITLTGLLFLNNSKKSNSQEAREIEELSESLFKLNQKIETQYASRTLNVNDIFLEYGYFKEKAIEHAGINDPEVLDSISQIGANVSIFNINGINKEHLEILFHLAELDTMLLKSNPENFFLQKKNSSQIIATESGSSFISFWQAKYKKLNLLFRLDLAKTKRAYEEIVENILFTTSALIIITLLFSLAMIAYVSLIIFRDLKVLKTNSKRVKSGKKPSIKSSKLFGESQEVYSDLFALFEDINQTKFMLEMIHSEQKSNIYGNNTFEDNILYESVSKLELQLAELKEKEKNRNWNIEGINLLTEVVNQFSNNPEELYSTFLLKLIKYLGAIQGGIFIAENEDELKMVASYAFDRIKQRKKTVLRGEGLVGQVWEEQKHLYTENIPKNHHHVKSALGEAKPTCLVITPLIDRQVNYGALEISSFNTFNNEELDLILKASGILASATSNIAANQNTKKLLEDSNILAKQMKEQEDELNKGIAELENKIEHEKSTAYLKERALRDLRFDFERTTELKDRQINNLEGRLEELKSSIKRSQQDNEFTRDLENKLEEQEKKSEDLTETIRIKNLKIERLKSKIEKLSN